MKAKDFEALVNKGAITHVGIAADVEKLSDKEVCDKFVTKHEVAAEVLSEPVAVATLSEEPAPVKKAKKAKKTETPAEPETPAETPAEVPVEE